MSFEFKKAQRSNARLRLALAAVSGGGKTMGALRLARGLMEYYIAQGLCTPGLEGKIAVIDTERRSASLYADVVPFDVLDLAPPYSVDRYQQAIQAAEDAGYLVCIIDQITHAWAGPGGQLEWIDSMKAGAKNAMSPWAKVTPVQQEFYDRMLRSPMHIMATMRCKSEYVLEEVEINGRKKTVPRKIGLAPVQRDGIEYEFTTCLEIDLDSHMATASKDRTRLFDGRTVKLDESVGRELAAWLLSGAPMAPADTQAGGAADGVAHARTPIERLQSLVTDYETAFADVPDTDELKEMWTTARKAVREYAPLLTEQVVEPFLVRVDAAKDKRKAALKTTASAPAPEQQGADEPAPDPAYSEAAPGQRGDEGPRVGADEVGALQHAQREARLTFEEGCRALGVDAYADVKLSTFATALDLLKLAGAQKAQRAEGAGKRTRRGVAA